MAKCQTCGAPLEAGRTVCAKCQGKPSEPAAGAGANTEETASGGKHAFDNVCGKCGALIPAGRETCLVCRTPRKDASYTGEFPVVSDKARFDGPARSSTPAARRTPDLWRRWGGAVAGSILLVLLVFGGVNVYIANFDTSSYRAREAVLYEAEGALMISHPGMERPKPVSGIEKPRGGYNTGRLRASGNGRWIAYTTASGELYILDLAQRGLREAQALEAVRLAEGLAQPAEFSLNSEFLIYLNKKSQLYASNMIDVWELDTGVEAVIALEERRVLYTRRGDKPGQLDLYLDYLPMNGGELQVIDRNVGEVLDWTGGFERLIYINIRNDEHGAEMRCLQLFELSRNLNKSAATTLAVGVGEVLDASAETGNAIFLVPQELQWRYEDLIEDDHALRDNIMTQPDIADYPLLERAMARFDSEEAFLEGMQDDEEILSAYTRFHDAQRQWENKVERDRLRSVYRILFEGLEGRALLSDLYVCANGEAAMLDSGVLDGGEFGPDSGTADVDRGFVIYQKVDPATIRKAKMSEIWNTLGDDFQPLTYYFDNAYRELLYAPTAGEPSRLYIRSDSSAYKQWRAASGSGGVYFTVGSPARIGADALYYAPVRNGAVESAALVQRGVAEITAGLREGILFATGGEDGALHFAQAGAPLALGARSPIRMTLAGAGSTLLYYSGSVPEGNAGTLCMFIREETVLADNVVEYAYRNDGLVYLLKHSGDPAALDLYSWQAGRESLVARDVRVVPGHNAGDAF